MNTPASTLTLTLTLPHIDQMIPAGDSRIEGYRTDIAMTGNPDLVYRASDIKDLREILAHCNAHRIPVTVCGNQTSVTGASVAESGLLVSTEKMDRILDIDFKADPPRATAQPGIFLAEFQDRLLAEGLFYPPDPTSRKEARLGGTVGTNANGEDSFLYGSTRHYIRALKYLTANGREHFIERKTPLPVRREKNRGGYFLNGDPIDLLIGSEGTLALITEITVELLRPEDHFAGIAFFANLSDLLAFVVSIEKENKLSPRALELMDDACLNIIKNQKECFQIPERAKAALYFKENYRSEADREEKMGNWLSALSPHALVDDTLIALDDSKKAKWRDLRHAIPATINERVARDRPNGGGKVAGDWWVPLPYIEEAMAWVLKESDQLACPHLLFGHIGNGHPHVNYLTRNAEERTKAIELITAQCKRAVAWGGGANGEHGIGKLKRGLLTIERTSAEIEQMLALKSHFDPHWILGQGTLFHSQNG